MKYFLWGGCSMLVGLALLTACRQSFTPKPRAYPRIDLPQKAYQTFDQSDYPFTFDYPVYAQIVPVTVPGEKYWLDVVVPSLNCRINFSYRPVSNNLDTNIRDVQNFVSYHQQKATGIRERGYEYPEGNVYGTVYSINGASVATTYQFYLTDKTRHFVKGALYFESVPNNDSLAPAIEFMKADIDRLIVSFRWK